MDKSAQYSAWISALKNGSADRVSACTFARLANGKALSGVGIAGGPYRGSWSLVELADRLRVDLLFHVPVGRSQCAGPTGRSNPGRTAGIGSVFIVISAAAGTTLRRYSEKERWLCRHNPNYRPTVLSKSREAKSHNVKGAARASPSTHPGCKTVSLPRSVSQPHTRPQRLCRRREANNVGFLQQLP